MIQINGNGNPGVTDIQTNVDTKSVIVQAEESVSPQFLLEKLLAVRPSLPGFEAAQTLYRSLYF